ncbi:MAG: hypothetical protein V1767_03625 [Chloroflexota bacterium]
MNLTNANGVFTSDASITSPNGVCSLAIKSGTTALDQSGSRLGSILIAPSANPPSAPGANIIGLAYELGPNGATFNPPITNKLPLLSF